MEKFCWLLLSEISVSLVVPDRIFWAQEDQQVYSRLLRCHTSPEVLIWEGTVSAGLVEYSHIFTQVQPCRPGKRKCGLIRNRDGYSSWISLAGVRLKRLKGQTLELIYSGRFIPTVDETQKGTSNVLCTWIVYQRTISKRFRNTLFPNLFFPIQTAVTHTILFSCTRFYYFVIIIGKIHTPPWNQFLELIFQNRFVCAWICRCVSAGIYIIFSADWSLWGLKVVKKKKKSTFLYHYNNCNLKMFWSGISSMYFLICVEDDVRGKTRLLHGLEVHSVKLLANTSVS